MTRKIAPALVAVLSTVTIASAEPAPANIGYDLSLGFPHYGGFGTNRLYHYPSYYGYGRAIRAYAYAPGQYSVPYWNSWDFHVSWCMQRYRTYTMASDSFMGNDGVPHRCISP